MSIVIWSHGLKGMILGPGRFHPDKTGFVKAYDPEAYGGLGDVRLTRELSEAC